MNQNDIVLILLTVIELANLTIRIMKLLPPLLLKRSRVSDEPREQPIDKNILKTM